MMKRPFIALIWPYSILKRRLVFKGDGNVQKMVVFGRIGGDVDDYPTFG